MTPIAIFVRVSTKSQEYDRQISDLTAYAEKHHYQVVSVISTLMSKDAYQLLTSQLKGNVRLDEQDKKHISISVNADSEFSGAEMMLSMLEVSKTLPEKERKRLHAKSENEQFIDQTTSLFKIPGELKKKKDKGLYWETYVSLFYKIAKSKHIDTYCYYISQSSNGEATKWLQENQEKIDQFSQWIGKK